MLLLLHFYVYFQLCLISSCAPRTYCIFSCRCCAQNVKFSKLGKWKWDFLLFSKNGVILIFSLGQLILIFSLIFSLCTMRNTGTVCPFSWTMIFNRRKNWIGKFSTTYLIPVDPKFSVFSYWFLFFIFVYFSLSPRTHTHTAT